MRKVLSGRNLWSALACSLALVVPSAQSLAADAPAKRQSPKAAASKAPATKNRAEAPAVNLLDAVRQGKVALEAKGIGDGRMTVSLTNMSNRQLRVVLPPGLVASGAAGQFGGMGGGMGGGGMGGMGGGMGGMGGGGMGGMGGGGMGGMGGGMGGMGGGMGGGGGGAMVMPASMGMMMLGRLIMYLVGDQDSWDQRSLMMGMMGGMGGGMGGMGGGMGGMGGMGGGGMGGMGGGMRSVPPTELPSAVLKPGQTRHLPTRLVSLSDPNAEGTVNFPAKDEVLQIGEIGQLSNNARVQAALKRLAQAKAPTTISQLVMWNVAAGLSWESIAGLSKNWANAHELALAKQLVQQLGSLPDEELGRLAYEVTPADSNSASIASELSQALKDQVVLGLKTKQGVPSSPDGPSVACRIQVTGTAEKPEAIVQVAASNGEATDWVRVGKFTLLLENGQVKSAALLDSLAEGVLSRLVRAQLKKGQKVKGKLTYQVTIENASPLILNGIAVLGEGTETDSKGAAKADKTPKVLAGIAISPRRSLTVPASSQMVEQLNLKKGVRVIAADLSGL